MTDEVFSDVTNKIVWDSGAGHVKHLWRRVNGESEIGPGDVVTEHDETYPDVASAINTDDNVIGVADLKPGHDIDTDYDDNEWIPIVPRGSGIGVHVKRQATNCGQAVESGDSVMACSEKGKVMKNPTSDNSYDGRRHVGTVAYAEAADTTDDKIIKIWLDGA